MCYCFLQVLKSVIEVLPETPHVTGVLVDFEAAMWRALKSVLPDVHVKGCSFHFSQAVWRKVQEIGLQVAYRQNDDIHKVIRYVNHKYLRGIKLLPVYRLRRDEWLSWPVHYYLYANVYNNLINLRLFL